jgi:hypothetical protein
MPVPARPYSYETERTVQIRSPASAAHRFRLFLLILPLFIIGGCGRVIPSEFSSDIQDLLSRGDAYSGALVQRAETSLNDEEIISLGYLERARLGVGSPFRLIAYARRDERLSEATREKLSYAVLSYTLHGRGYQVDPTVLDILQFLGVTGRSGLGEYHLNLIERTIADAPSALNGERAVRFGYLLAGTERTIEVAPEPVVGYVAALVADRRRAREDASHLLRAASRQRVDPLELLEEWRRELRFSVEAPAMAPIAPADEVTETVRGTQLAVSLRTLSQRLSAPAAGQDTRPRQDFWSRAWLSPGSAQRMQTLAGEHDYPAQAPVAVAVMINREAMVSRSGLTPWQKRQRARFADAAINEEKLVAAAANLAAYRAGRGPRVSLVLLQASVFMRGWNQEEPWLPGDPAPSSRDLENRFGLASVSFETDVPDAWRPYYRRMLGRSLSDLQRVLPTASLRGLNVRIGPTPSDGGALALHDPRTRTLIMPVSSGAGTLAHEIAHDLDWQLARNRYGRRGGYATDLAVSRQKGDRLATSLEGLVAAFARDPGDGAATNHDRRPAEVFARGMDWLVAAYLAAEGRTGGYLTSYQDVALAGYGTTRGPQVDGAAVPALFGILDQIAPVTPSTRAWAMDTYGPTRTLTGKELVRAIASASREGSAFSRFAAVQGAQGRALAGLSAASCRMAPSYDARRVAAVRQQAIRAAMGAATRGIIIDGIRAVAAELEEPPAAEAVDEFLIWRLDGGPEPADSSVQRLQPAADEMILRAGMLTGKMPVSSGGFRLNAERALCGGNPFASEKLERRETLFPSLRRPQ